MSEKAWNSLQWEPDFAPPDRVTSQLTDITNVVTAQNGTKYLKINQTAFDSAGNNFIYANEFNNTKSYLNSNSGSTNSYGTDNAMVLIHLGMVGKVSKFLGLE